MRTRSPAAVVLAVLAAVVVLVRVVTSTVRTVVSGTGSGPLTVATLVLLLAAVGLVAAVTWFVSVEPRAAARTVLARAAAASPW